MTWWKSAFFYRRVIARVKPYLLATYQEKVVHAFITSHIDYCSAMYVGLDQSSLRRLQLSQNAADRLLTGTEKHNPLTDSLFFVVAFLQSRPFTS